MPKIPKLYSHSIIKLLDFELRPNYYIYAIFAQNRQGICSFRYMAKHKIEWEEGFSENLIIWRGMTPVKKYAQILYNCCSVCL